VKTIPIALQTELDSPTPRLARCLRIVRRDGNVYRFTTGTRALVIEGETYLPAYAFSPSDIATASDLDTDDLQVEGLLSSDTITEDDIRAGRWDFAEFRAFTVSWAAPADGVRKDRAGRFGKVTVNRSTFVAEMLGLMESYSVGIGKITQPGCRANYGDAQCTLVPTQVTGAIELCQADFFTLEDSARGETAGFFDEGIITFTSGEAEGIAREIKSYAPGVMVTKISVPYDVTGASYTMTEGCVRTHAACLARGNVVNFRGEPWLRGVDVMVQSGRHT
jgi:uncharacterized phage protein (TIGR02218 family)